MTNVGISITELYGILSAKVGREEAKSITNYIDTKIEKHIEDKTRILATKDDIISLQRRMLGIFISLMLAILALYHTILFR